MEGHQQYAGVECDDEKTFWESHEATFGKLMWGNVIISVAL